MLLLLVIYLKVRKGKLPKTMEKKLIRKKRKSVRLQERDVRKIQNLSIESMRQINLEKKERYLQRMTKWSREMTDQHNIPNENGECLAYDMLTDPTANQLAGRDKDAISAKMAFAIDTGLGRMKDARHLHHELSKIKDGISNGKDVPHDFEPLKKEIEKENDKMNLERVVQSFKH